jgi:hypothetical protein
VAAAAAVKEGRGGEGVKRAADGLIRRNVNQISQGCRAVYRALVAFTCLCVSEQTERKQSDSTTIRRAPAIFNYLPVRKSGGVAIYARTTIITDRQRRYVRTTDGRSFTIMNDGHRRAHRSRQWPVSPSLHFNNIIIIIIIIIV